MHDARTASRQLRDLLRREHATMAEFLLALADFDRARGWEALGYTSCFYYLHRELGLSKSAAFYRSSAAELLQGYPEVAEPLRDGRLCLSSVAELAKVITPENRGHVVARFFHASKQEAKAVVAELLPAAAPPTRDVVTAIISGGGKAPTGAHAPVPAIEVKNLVRLDEPNAPARGGASARGAASAPVAVPRDFAEPLTADLRRFHVTVSQRFLDKLATARDALSNGRPDATTEDVLDAALDLLLAKAAAARGLVKKPRTAPPASSEDPRRIPAAVKRAVWLRDSGRCQFQLASGERCGSTRRLELDHVVPVALGGPSTVENLRVTCHAHNQLAARRAFGEAWMARFAPNGSAGPPREPASHPPRTSTAVS
jgi:HNH endonuclease